MSEAAAAEGRRTRMRSHAAARQIAPSERAFVLTTPCRASFRFRRAMRPGEALGSERNRFVAAVVGRISDWKGQDVFARALAERPLAELGACGVLAGEAAPGQPWFECRLEGASPRSPPRRPLDDARLQGGRGDGPRCRRCTGRALLVSGPVPEHGAGGRRGGHAGRRHHDRRAGRDRARRSDGTARASPRPRERSRSCYASWRTTPGRPAGSVRRQPPTSPSDSAAIACSADSRSAMSACCSPTPGPPRP